MAMEASWGSRNEGIHKLPSRTLVLQGGQSRRLAAPRGYGRRHPTCSLSQALVAMSQFLTRQGLAKLPSPREGRTCQSHIKPILQFIGVSEARATIRLVSGALPAQAFVLVREKMHSP